MGVPWGAVSDASEPDPENERVNALMIRAMEGSDTPAEREELVLYAERDPQVLARLEHAERQGRLARGWLERVRGDSELQRVEHSRSARLERGVGLGLLAVGTVLTFVAPVLGSAALGAGALTLLISFVRVRLSTHAADPYKDVMR